MFGSVPSASIKFTTHRVTEVSKCVQITRFWYNKHAPKFFASPFMEVRISFAKTKCRLKNWRKNLVFFRANKVSLAYYMFYLSNTGVGDVLEEFPYMVTGWKNVTRCSNIFQRHERGICKRYSNNVTVNNLFNFVEKLIEIKQRTLW